MNRPSLVIESARLYLRELEFGDADFIVELLNETGFLRFIGDKGVRTHEDARAYIAQGPMASYLRFGFGLYLVALLDGAASIGICGLVKRDALSDVDIGFAFLARHWSNGYAAESAAAVLAHAHGRLGLRRIVAITMPDNVGSSAVLRKIGLKFERRIRLGDDGPELDLYGPAPAHPPSAGVLIESRGP